MTWCKGARVVASFAASPINKGLLPRFEGPARQHFVPARPVKVVDQSKLHCRPSDGRDSGAANALVLVMQRHVRMEMAAYLRFAKPHAAHDVAQCPLKPSQLARCTRLCSQLNRT